MNKIIIDDEIGGWGITAQNIKMQLDRMQGDIEVHISSPGGSIFEGIEIYNALKAYDKGEVHTICTSLAGSIASYIVLAGDKVSFYDNAVFMYHFGWAFTMGNHEELRQTADVLEGLSSLMCKKYVEVTGKDRDTVWSEMAKDTFYFGDEVLKNGFCHEIISTSTETEMARNETFALASERLKACEINTNKHFNKSEFVQLVAKLTKEESKTEDEQSKVEETVVEEILPTEVVANAQHLNRLKELEILQLRSKI